MHPWALLAAMMLAGCSATGKVEMTGYRSGGQHASTPQSEAVEERSSAWSARTPGQAEPRESDVVVVRSGDTLSSIAKAQGVTVDMLYSANGLRHDRLEPGQQLVVPRVNKRQGKVGEAVR